jgi:hypothetical protein
VSIFEKSGRILALAGSEAAVSISFITLSARKLTAWLPASSKVDKEGYFIRNFSLPNPSSVPSPLTPNVRLNKVIKSRTPNTAKTNKLILQGFML